MKKILLIAQLLILCITAIAQPLGSPGSTVNVKGALQVDSLSLPPTFTDTPSSARLRRQGAIIRIKKTAGDTINYVFKGSSWVPFNAISGVDTAVPFHYWFIGGQSNAGGQGAKSYFRSRPGSNISYPYTGVTYPFLGVVNNVYIVDSNGTPQKLNPSAYNNQTSDTAWFGPEVPLAFKWSIDHPQGDILLIQKDFQDGQGIASFISGPYTNAVIRKHDSAIRYMRTKLKRFTVKHDAWFWIQGESDNTATYTYYKKSLDSLHGLLLPVFDFDTRLIISGMKNPSVGYNTATDSAQKAFVAQHTFGRFLNNDSATLSGNIHYVAYSMLQLGFNGFASTYDADSNRVDTTYRNYPNYATGTAGQVAGWQDPNTLTSYPLAYSSASGGLFGYNTTPNVSNGTHNFHGIMYCDASIVTPVQMGCGTFQLGYGQSRNITFTNNATDGTLATFSGTGSAAQLTINNTGGLVKINGDFKASNILYVGNYIGGGAVPTSLGFIFQAGLATGQLLYSTGSPLLINTVSLQDVKSGGNFYALAKLNIATVNANTSNNGGFLVKNSSTGDIERVSLNYGNATLASGTKAVTDASITANSIIVVSYKSTSGSTGDLTYTLSAGSGFTINSSSAADNSIVSYFVKY